MYKVISYFTDLQDHNHPYNVGDIFPRNGLKVSEERLKELSSNKNKQNKPLIKLIEEKKANVVENKIDTKIDTKVKPKVKPKKTTPKARVKK